MAQLQSQLSNFLCLQKRKTDPFFFTLSLKLFFFYLKYRAFLFVAYGIQELTGSVKKIGCQV